MRTWPGFLFSLLFLLVHVCLVTSRTLSVITQTNISSQYLIDPSLDLPFTSFLYISAGFNATQFPPITVRIAQMQDANSTDGWSLPKIIATQHQPNFTVPDLMNAPSGIAWHVSNIGTLNDTLSQNFSSKDFMRTWGAGLFFDFWSIAADEAAGSYILGKADENVLCRVIIERLGLGNTDGAKKYASLVDQWETKVTIKYKLPDEVTGKVQGRIMRMVTADTGEILDFEFKDPIAIGPSPSTESPDGWVRTGTIDGAANVRYTGQLYQGIYKKVFNTAMRGANTFIRGALQPSDSSGSWQGCKPLNTPSNQASSSSSSADGSGEGSSSDVTASSDDESDVRSSGPSVPDEAFETPVSMIRQQGIMQTISLVSQEAAMAAGITVVAAAAAFVIVDFVDGNYVGGSMGVIGILAASLLPLFIEGPIGVLFGTVVALLFFLLPGMFGKRAPEKPPLNNTTEIIQYTFFGDASHTGNEKCQQTNPNCIASYGPGILATTMDWEYFDAVAFLLWANQGFPMTIPDMAAAFGNASSFDDSANGSTVAQITCGNFKDSHIETTRNGMEWSSTDNNYCTTPKFHLNRDLINLPNINQTAGVIYNQIIGGPGDDNSCKIIDNADNAVSVPNYGITVQGLPVAIACGINATIPGDSVVSGSSAASGGTVSASNNGSGTLPPGSSPGSLSTDGRGGEGYVPPPPPTPFANTLNPSNSACFTATNLPNLACLPNGTYNSQQGTFNVYNSKIDGLYMPPGTVLNYQYETWGRNWPIHHDVSISSNQTSSSSDGDDEKTQFSQFAHMSSETFDILVPAQNITLPPIACLFTKAQYGGDVTCVGVGGGNMTEGRGQVGSVAIYGGASVTLYPNAYGDPGGQSSAVSLPDLTSVPYGTDSNLMNNVVAVLVLAHPTAIA